MRYQEYFSIHVSHAYLEEGKADICRLIPANETANLLKGHKIKVVQKPLVFSFFQPLSDDGITPLIPVETGTTFNFELQFTAPEYATITAWSAVSLNQMLKGEALPMFSNESLTAAQTLLPAARYEPQASHIFQVKEAVTTEPFYLADVPRPGLTAADFTISDLGSVTTPASYIEHEKKLLIDTSAVSAGHSFEVSYPILKRAHVLSVKVQIIQNASLVNQPAFEIDFNTTDVLWRCYVVLKQGETQVSITDDDAGRAGGSVVFTPTTLLTSGNADPMDDRLAASQADKTIVLLTANRALPYRRKPYRQFRLSYLQTGETTPIEIPHIPNPDTQSEGRIVIYLS